MGLKIDDVVQAVSDIATTEFPDLGFLDPGGQLDIRARLPKVTCLRVEIPTTEFLHLTSVLIDAEGTGDVTTDAERVTSSTWRGYGKHLQHGYLFDPHFRGTGIHTRREPRPWLEVRFPSTVTLERIRIRNRNNSTALRARGIRILVRLENGRWDTVHDAADREIQFTQATERIYGSVEDAVTDDESETAGSVTLGADLARIVTQLHLREYNSSLARQLRALNLSAAGKAEFRESANHRVLFARELEWTSHGVRRSFRFWSQEEKKDYVSYAMTLVKDLRELTENVCLGFGSVLSIVRDNDLIPHDDDLDIIVGIEPAVAATIKDSLCIIENFLTRKGYTVSGTHTAHRLVSRPGVKKVDVFVGIFEGDEIAWYPGHRGALRRDIVFPSRNVGFMGVTCSLPADPKLYLEQIYGPSWVVPDPNFKHSGNRQEYADVIR